MGGVHVFWKDAMRLLFFCIIGTDVYDKVVAICGRTQMLNDVKKLSPEVQTSHLEAFHSTLNQFHPKMTAYSYTGTYCRYNIL